MTSLEQHKNNLHQFLDDIKEKVRAGLLLERQKIIGFAASGASTNLLEYFFHKKNLISLGFNVNHNYFASAQRAKQHLNFYFPRKEELIGWMVEQDRYRNLLCYGKEKELKVIEEAIANLNRIKKAIEEELGEEL